MTVKDEQQAASKALGAQAMALPGWVPVPEMVGWHDDNACVILSAGEGQGAHRLYVVMPLSGQWRGSASRGGVNDITPRAVLWSAFIPNINAPGTLGPLLVLLGGKPYLLRSGIHDAYMVHGVGSPGYGPTWGQACLGAAQANGCWPGSATPGKERPPLDGGQAPA